MSKFLRLLEKIKQTDQEFVAGINGREIRVKVHDITGDMVTLDEQESQNRYDLHYTQIIISSLRQ